MLQFLFCTSGELLGEIYRGSHHELHKLARANESGPGDRSIARHVVHRKLTGSKYGGNESNKRNRLPTNPENG